VKAPAGNRTRLASIVKKHAPAEIPPPPIWSEGFAGDPVALFVHSILAWEAPLATADAAFEKLSKQLVDWNDLRVCLVDETMEIVGPRYPNAFRRLLLLRTSLTAIYKKHHEVDLRHLSAAGKREARAYLEGIPEVPSFVAHRTLLLAFGSSVMPMDARLLVKLQQAGVVDPEASESAVAAWIAKETPNDGLVEAHYALHAFADSTPDRAVGGKGARTAGRTPKAAAEEGDAAAASTTSAAGKAPTASEAKRSSAKKASTGGAGKTPAKSAKSAKPAKPAGKASASGAGKAPAKPAKPAKKASKSAAKSGSKGTSRRGSGGTTRKKSS